MRLAGLGRIGVLAVLAGLLAGCAAGSPAIVPPEAGDSASLAPVVLETPTPTSVVLSDAPTAAPAAAPPEPRSRRTVAPDVPTGDDGQKADPTPDSGSTAAPGDTNAAQRVAFAQGAIQSLAPEPEAPTAPQPDGNGQPAAAQAAPESASQAALPAAQGGERPPARAAPSDGMSLLVEGGNNGRPEVALTFDAGADTGYAEAILDLLRDEGIPATFGITGQWAELNPELIRRMVAEGHQLINHTWTHQSMTGVNGGLPPMDYAQLADELARTEQIVLDLTGYAMAPYYRPPYGDYDAATLGWLFELGYPFTIMWTCDSQGWKGWDAYQILEYCTQVPLEDEIILMHVGAAAAGDYEALPLLVDHYRRQGHAFVTVEQMLQP